MDKSKYETLFNQIIKKKHGMVIDFEIIEAKLGHLREGDALTYSDLEIIANDKCWPFNKYWMWPSKDQIEEKLKGTNELFKNLPGTEENEKKVINNLDEIFKNIALVSIILRFICPKYYAIYSRPPLKILRIERGTNDIEEYLNYVGERRLLKRSFQVVTTAEVDMIVWAIAQEKGAHLREFKKLLAKQLPENLKPGELITYLSNDPLKIAEIFFRQMDHKTAGFWATRAYEKFLRDKCVCLIGFIPSRENGEIITLIDYLCSRPEYKHERNTFHKIRRLRNKAVHESKDFTKNDAKDFIERLKSLILINGNL